MFGHSLLAAALAAAAVCFRAGPFELSFPVRGLGPAQLPAAARALKKALPGNVHGLRLAPGGKLVLTAGGKSPTALVRLSAIRAALGAEHVAPERWLLEPSVVGLEVAVRAPATAAALAKKLAAADLELAGTILTPAGAILVVSITKPTPYLRLAELLRPQARLRDLVWGHWAYGFGIEAGRDLHAHFFSAGELPARGDRTPRPVRRRG